MSRDGQSANRRLSTMVVDQIISGGSNLLVAVLAAHALSVADFGLFGIVFLIFVVVQAASRSLVCEPLLVHPDEAQERPGDIIGTACLLGLLLGSLVAVSGVTARIWHDDLGRALLALAICMPFLVLQDLGRYLAFATQRPSAAVLLDSVWLVLMIATATLVIMAESPTVFLFLLSWAGSGAVGGVLMLWQHRGARVKLNLSWLRDTWHMAWRYLVSNIFNQGSALAAALIVAGLAGAVALGALRGAQLLIRPFMTFYIAAASAGVSELARLSRDAPAFVSHVRRTTVITATVALLNMAFLLLIPDNVGELMIGETWHEAKVLLLPAAVHIVLVGLMSGARVGLLGMRAIRKIMYLDMALVVSIVVLTTVGLVLGDVVTAYWALAVGQGILTLVMWAAYLTHTVPPAGETGRRGKRRAGGAHRGVKRRHQRRQTRAHHPALASLPAQQGSRRSGGA